MMNFLELIEKERQHGYSDANAKSDQDYLLNNSTHRYLLLQKKDYNKNSSK